MHSPSRMISKSTQKRVTDFLIGTAHLTRLRPRRIRGSEQRHSFDSGSRLSNNASTATSRKRTFFANTSSSTCCGLVAPAIWWREKC